MFKTSVGDERQVREKVRFFIRIWQIANLPHLWLHSRLLQVNRLEWGFSFMVPRQEWVGRQKDTGLIETLSEKQHTREERGQLALSVQRTFDSTKMFSEHVNVSFENVSFIPNKLYCNNFQVKIETVMNKQLCKPLITPEIKQLNGRKLQYFGLYRLVVYTHTTNLKIERARKKNITLNWSYFSRSCQEVQRKHRQITSKVVTQIK